MENKHYILSKNTLGERPAVMWGWMDKLDDEEKQMLYDITIIPKYSVKEKPIPATQTLDPVEEVVSPQTADTNHSIKYMNLGIISLIILVIMSCHNRFNCDTMTGKYSKNGGQSNGNDNDTENPRSTCRIRFSSPGSID